MFKSPCISLFQPLLGDAAPLITVVKRGYIPTCLSNYQTRVTLFVTPILFIQTAPSRNSTMWGPRSIAKLVNITPITMVYGTYINIYFFLTIVNGGYKPTYNWWSHIVLDDWIMFGGLLVSMVVTSTHLVLWMSMCVVLWHFLNKCLTPITRAFGTYNYSYWGLKTNL